ncbi:short-chain dehydrogenase reductase 3b-like isoform X3 [Pistacia vera]|uniref:short-chain dehydrogenase reductase 3b-like isoform X2 n=1 Tax=Pistacia vera TaxID=55513 RepID=UPI001263BD7C|nr:short-chain dehydrogenase reductase 3b-like isoform X2 [Pistacia vera]XP_031280705.1 short-chain dehydrogenase reductase 3b-like isoform X3 [Pistacia vera]
MSKLRLEGKVAIITGAASGIGEAAAKLFAEHGAFVIIADVQDVLANEVVASIGPDKACYRHCDVTDEKQIEETVAYAIEKYGTLDIMYSNAGILGPLGSILDLEMDQFDNTIAVNLRGSVLAVKHAARAMVANKIRGSIICTGSLASSLGGSGPHAYTMSKHGLLGLVRAASGELGRHGIRVNCVSPNGVSTPMACKVANSDPSTVDARSAQLANLKGIVLKAEHVAQSALFLASDESVYISGHNLAVDGGFSAISSIMSLTKH